MMRRVAVCAVAAGLCHGAAAQSPRAADSLLESGRLERAESLYYAAARARPHDPVARWALGRYLAARGAQRVAMTLFEESLKFGGRPSLVNAELAPLYLGFGEYRALLALSPTPLTAAERERAAWLEAHPTRLVAPDSILAASYRDAGDSGYVGRLPIRVNGRTVDALVDPGTRGVVLSDSTATLLRVRRFGAAARAGGHVPGPAAADSLAIGRLTLTNMPITIGPGARPAIIGLDVLARLAPTFDAPGSRVTLRVSGSVAALPGTAAVLATLVRPSDWLVSQAGGWASLRSPQVGRLLRGRRWTLDAKRGELILE